MLDSTKIIVTRHAYDRFVERGGHGDIANQVRRARIATKAERLRISQSCPQNCIRVVQGSGFLYYVSATGWVFAIESAVGRVRVVTCWPLNSVKPKTLAAQSHEYCELRRLV